MIASKFSASCTLIWFCCSAGNDHIILFNVCTEDLEWIEAMSRCHVSANRIAFLIHSKSLISQNKITSGLCLSVNLLDDQNQIISFHNSFCSMMDLAGLNLYSIGSSNVMICFA
ncbi:MAG: hypothetical protein WCG25_04870 [bacterium]